MNNFNDFLADKNNLKSLKKIVSTPEGQRMLSQLKTMNKSQLMQMWNQINPDSTIDKSKMSHMAQDPAIIHQINDFINKNRPL